MTPEPPPHGTVVVDRNGHAWQRLGHGPIGWRYIANRHDWFTWSQVCREGVPTIVWTPDTPTDERQLDLFGGAA